MKTSKLFSALFALLPILVFSSCAHKPKTPYQEKLSIYDSSKVATRADEVRALWVVRSQIKSRQDITSVIDKMLELKLNTAVVQVRGLSDVLYPSSIEGMADEIEEGLDDPFGVFLGQAIKSNIRVQAWLNVNMLSKPDFLDEYTKAKSHLVTKKPAWVLKDQFGKSMLEYPQGQLESDWMDGAYANPGVPQWRKYFISIVTEIQKAYPSIEGIHLDFIRYPYAKDGGKVFGFDKQHMKPVSKFLGLSTEDLKSNPHYQKALDLQKLIFMNQFVKEIRDSVKRTQKDHILSAAVWAHKKKALENVYQDWPLWLRKNYIDQAYMMIYVTDTKVHDKRMEEFFDEDYFSRVVGGIGLYRSPSTRVLKHQLKSMRATGTAGFCLFSAKNLLEEGDEFHRIKKILAPR